MTSQAPTLLDQIGGLDALRRIVVDFYERVFADAMIGYMFADADPQRLVDKETELVARMLGGSHIAYTGMPMRKAHQRHRIFGGQFERRQQILRETLADHDVPSQARGTWLGHNDRLRAQVTFDPGSDCGAGMARHAADTAEPSAERHLTLRFPGDEDDD